MKKEGSNLIIVSNRLPIQLTERDGRITLRESDGGLVSALKSYFDRTPHPPHFAGKIWIGIADFPAQRWNRYEGKKSTTPAFTIEPIFTNRKDYNKYYNGFCNATLWPLFHYFPSFVEYSDENFESYERINEQFCEHVLSIVKPGDTVWVHDYQLMLLPGLLRKKMPGLQIGFFLHVPFPSFELFRLLHTRWKKGIIQGLLGADLVGFHTYGYMHHFIDSAYQILGAAHEDRVIAWDNRQIKVNIFPLGIDFGKFHDPDTKGIHQEKEIIQSRFADSRIIFSVDRLDYTKGITHRLAGYERFLEMYPVWRDKVIFVLVVVPSRQIISKYNERKKMIDELVSRINGKYSTLHWQPILYRYNTLSFQELSSLYQAAHVALITPLRDGMNLVAKEYVASRKKKNGVLILSELAGAAHEMSEALLVNPTDKTEVARSIANALNMGEHEQEQRVSALQDKLRKNDVVNWVNSYLSQLDEAISLTLRQAIPVTETVSLELSKMISRSGKKILLLDYDGTLVPFQDDPCMAMPPPGLLKSLTQIAALCDTEVVIISGRGLDTLSHWFDGLPVHLVAEHGAVIKPKGLPAQKQIDRPVKFNDAIRSTFDLFTFRCPGSRIEEKEFSLAWHYRKLDEEEGFKQSKELTDCLNHLIRGTALGILQGNKVIEIRSMQSNKGIAAQKISRMLGAELAIVFGDDRTDEDMFETLTDQGITIKVGQGPTKAGYRLANQDLVLPFLKTLFL